VYTVHYQVFNQYFKTVIMVCNAVICLFTNFISPLTFATSKTIGTTKLKRLEENIQSINVEISPEELTRINDMLNSIPVSGDRYPAELAKRVGK